MIMASARLTNPPARFSQCKQLSLHAASCAGCCAGLTYSSFTSSKCNNLGLYLGQLGAPLHTCSGRSRVWQRPLSSLLTHTATRQVCALITQLLPGLWVAIVTAIQSSLIGHMPTSNCKLLAIRLHNSLQLSSVGVPQPQPAPCHVVPDPTQRLHPTPP